MVHLKEGEGQRLKRLAVSAERLLDLLSGFDSLRCSGYVERVTQSYLPHDAKIVAIKWDFELSLIWVMLSSEEFPEVPIGHVIPEINGALYTTERFPIKQLAEAYKPAPSPFLTDFELQRGMDHLVKRQRT